MHTQFSPLLPQVNPRSALATGQLAADLLALSLNVAFDDSYPDFAPTKFHFRDFVVIKGTSPCANMTVAQVCVCACVCVCVCECISLSLSLCACVPVPVSVFLRVGGL